MITNVRTDCRHYRGRLPCKPHKSEGVHCEDCPHYDALYGHILIVKLGAMGDVIRTTPLLHRLKKEYPRYAIHWLTDFPDAVPRAPWVDRVYKYDARSIVILEQFSFDRVYCLDKDVEAVAITERVRAKHKFGYRLKDNAVVPVLATVVGKDAAKAARHKWETGLFDDTSKANTQSYQQEIFAICGYEFTNEEYIVPVAQTIPFELPTGKRIGLNTGCGGRWPSRLWPEEYWVKLIEALRAKGYSPVILGGPEEHEKNLRLQSVTNAPYYGTMPLAQFDALQGSMDVVVTAVTMAMHLAIGRKRRLVLFNNIFNKHEFVLYGRGEILEPEPACKCYYANECPHGGCMQNLSVERVLAAIERQVALV
ncbi:MAG: glycosyltransferase family 9 protein [bacterium]|nr:glycosyltransferase family 9 protein [bacterium]